MVFFQFALPSTYFARVEVWQLIASSFFRPVKGFFVFSQMIDMGMFSLSSWLSIYDF
jgi:hypothetical protein